MDWLDIVKLAIPAAICAFFLGLRNATAFLLVMVSLMVFGLGFWDAMSGDGSTLGGAVVKVMRQGLPLFGRMMAGGAAGIVVGWWLRTWIAMARSSRMTREQRSTI
jgi:hypothetical protein